MAGQTEFLQAIQELERLGETNGNQLSMEEINSYFSDMKLEEKQLDFICNYFESHHIYITNRVQRFEEEIGDEEIPNKEDCSFLLKRDGKSEFIIWGTGKSNCKKACQR